MKQQREEDEIEGERAPKRMKVDKQSTPEAYDENQFGCIVCDLDNDLAKLNFHKDCVKAIIPAVGIVCGNVLRQSQVPSPQKLPTSHCHWVLLCRVYPVSYIVVMAYPAS